MKKGALWYTGHTGYMLTGSHIAQYGVLFKQVSLRLIVMRLMWLHLVPDFEQISTVNGNKLCHKNLS